MLLQRMTASRPAGLPWAMVRIVARHLQTAAPSRSTIIVARCVLRCETNGSSGECREAAYCQGERRPRAESAGTGGVSKLRC